jgi:putative spermidine/putrescine transport system permease protein
VALTALGAEGALENYGTALGLLTSALGAHLTWTLPFGLLIMFAVFNRFNPAYEEAARDLGATPWQTFRHVVLPLIAPSVVGIGMFGFTLSWDEIARTSQAIGDVNTLPLELQGLTSTVTTPAIYALGTVTTVVSFLPMKKRRAWPATCAGRSGWPATSICRSRRPPATRRWAASCANWCRAPR